MSRDGSNLLSALAKYVTNTKALLGCRINVYLQSTESSG